MEEEENELQWEIMHNVSGNLKCKEGYTKVGCCKCVHDDHIAAKPTKLVVPDMKAASLKYHGLDGEVKPPTATAASPPNVLGWFSGSDDKEKEDDKEKKERGDDDERRDRKGRDDDERRDRRGREDDDSQRRSDSEQRQERRPEQPTIHGDYESGKRGHHFTMSTPEEQTRSKSIPRDKRQQEDRERQEQK